MKDTILTILNSSIIITFFTIFIPFVLNYFDKRNNRKREIYEKQLYNVYLPIFQFIEPYLYKNITLSQSNKIIRYVDELIKNQYIFFYSETIIRFKKFKYDKNYNNFNNFCEDIDENFEELKSSLYLPKRTPNYRKIFNQKSINININKAAHIDILILSLIILIYTIVVLNIIITLN